MVKARDLYGAPRFVAGTDGPFCLPAVKDAIVQSVFQDPEEQAKVFGGNLCTLLGLPE